MSKMGDRARVIRENYRMAKQYDPKLGWILMGILVVGSALVILCNLAADVACALLDPRIASREKR